MKCKINEKNDTSKSALKSQPEAKKIGQVNSMIMKESLEYLIQIKNTFNQAIDLVNETYGPDIARKSSACQLLNRISRQIAVYRLS
jgi:hypothetical protein